MLIKLFYLTPNVSNVIGNGIVPMPFAFMIVNDQAKGNDQLKVAVTIGIDRVVVAVKPAHSFFLPPGDLGIVPVNRIFSATVPVNVIHIRTAMALVMHVPEGLRPEFIGAVEIVKPDLILRFPEEPLLIDCKQWTGTFIFE